MNEQDEAIVRRFGLQEENFIAVDSTIVANEWGASKEQIYEFQIAFDIVGDGAKQINEQQVNDLFLAIGYTMQDFELEILFQKCIRGEGGTFTCEVLLEGLSLKILKNPIRAIIFGYSYDITTSTIKNYSNGTHEIMLGYCHKFVKPEKPFSNPVFGWA